VSKDDGDKNESNSIKNQRDLILDFVEKNSDIRIVNIVADDGATGANFDRTAFKDMISHIESGAVNCVLVKDFSRLGRDHIETGKIIERYFASKNVRFISINDHYDSLHADMNDSNNSLLVPFKNIINEAFLEDISIKTKSQLAIKRKNGEFVCNYTTFGYAKSSDKKLIVDDYAAEVVKAIFEHKLLGYNEQQIANALNIKGIHSPAEYKKASGQAYDTPFAVNEKSLWTAKAVKRILENRVYIGVLEQGKRTKTSYRVKNHFYKPRETWSVHENNHEPIISVIDFELVQELMKKDTRVSGGTGQLQLFSGLIICGACSQAMTVKTTKKYGKCYINYICSTHKRHGTCTNNNISGKKVEEYTLLAIRNQIAGLISTEETAGDIGLDELRTRKKAAIEGMIEKSLLVIQEYNDYLVKSCAHMLNGVITEDEYKIFRDDFCRQISETEKNIVNLRNEIERIEDNSKNHALIEQFKTHGNITELTRRIVVGFICSIVVHANKILEINLRYQNGFETLPEYTSTHSCAYERVVG
jgi:DNA invertase Pin-like site-specific DNA recombinase